MLPKSIRRQLPLTYAGIALLAALALGTVLLLTLRGYYSQQEIDYLKGNAETISQILGHMYANGAAKPELQSQLESLSFLTQARVQVLNAEHEIIADSGSFQNARFIALNYKNQFGNPPPPNAGDVGYSPVWGTSEAVPLIGAGGGGLAAQNTRWVGGISLFNRQISVSSVQAADASRQDFMITVAGTPYGFGLNTPENSPVRSNQSVETKLFASDQHPLGYVILSEGPSYGMDIVQGIARALVGAGFLAVCIAAGVGWIISRRMTAPLHVLTQTTLQMAEGKLSSRVELFRRDEFGLLARTFNEMASRVENTVTMLQRFVADAAHELHTPITAVHANLELAASESDDRRRAQFIIQAQDQLTRLEVLTNNLLDLSRIESRTLPVERAAIDFVHLVRESSELYASRAEQKGIRFEFQVPHERMMVRISESQFRRVLGNLLDNAIKFTPENGTIWLGVCRDGETIRLWVRDTGIGIPEEDLPYLFSRFRRGRNAASYPGSGLGLAIIQAIVEGHRGKVNVESGQSGTHFWVQIPALI